MSLALVVLGAALVAAVACFGLLAPSTVERGLLALGLFTVTWMDVRVAESVTLSDVLLAAALCFVLLGAARGASVVGTAVRRCRWMYAVAVLVLVGGSVGAFATEGPAGASVAMTFAMSVVLATFVIAAVVASEASWRWSARWLVAGAAVSAIVAIANPGQFGLGRALGLSNHPNHLGLSMLVAAVLLPALVHSRDRRDVTVGVIAAPLIVAAMLMSGSRAALAGLLAAGFVLVAVSRGVRVVASVLGSLAAVVAVIVLPEAVSPGSTSLQRVVAPSVFEQRSSELRIENYREALELIRERPLTGHGFADTLTSHSVPLQLLVVAGVFGVAALLVAARAAFRAVRAASRPGASVVTRVSAAGLVGIFTSLAVSNQLFDRYLTVTLALLTVGVGGAIRSRATPVAASTSDRRRRDVRPRGVVARSGARRDQRSLGAPASSARRNVIPYSTSCAAATAARPIP